MGLFDAQGIDTSKPQSQQINANNISTWAQPYVNNYLNKAQNLVNNFQPTAFQNQVAASAQGMGTPEQFGMGTNLAQQGGQGALSTAPVALQYGQQGSGIGALGAAYGFGAGQNYANQATNPYAVGAYMNPYIQQSLAPQLGLLNQQQQIEQQRAQGQATAQGAFGGNRAALTQGLIGQNYDLAKQQAIGQGYNQAFQNAQQAQQFGANLGLQGAMQGTSAALQGTGLGLQGVGAAQQGYQGATQAGSALGNIGAQQGQYNLGLLALQNQIANQQQQLPYQNLQFGQSMLAGLPVSSGTTTGFQAAPNLTSQLAGLGTSLVGGYGLYNKLFGGSSPTTPTPTSSPTIPNIPYGGDARDIGLNETPLSGASAADLPYDVLKAKGGRIKEKSYAAGGLVSLAIKNALEG